MQRQFSVAMLCFIIATASYGQQTVTSASVSGTVLDPAGGSVAAATVTITDLDRNRTQSITSNDRGRFRFPFLSLGRYEIQVDAAGFAPFKQPLVLTIGSALDVPVRLRVAQSASIEVESTPPLIETERTQVTSRITSDEVRDLPLNGRNYLDLALLAPGVSRTNTGANQRFAETSAVPGTGISISTQRNLANSFLVDGLSANDDAAELAGTFFSQEVIREFAVVRAGGVAEFGRASGGIINIATQSGTNALRGNAYGFFRNDRWDALNALSSTKLPLDQQQYGLSIGGPLVANRTFYFTNAEQFRQQSGGVITIAPANVTAINQRLDQVGYAGPRIATGPFDTTLDSTNLFARVDHTLTSTNQLTLRGNAYDVRSTNARTVGGLNAVSRGTNLDNRDVTIAANDLWTISDGIVSETRAQAIRSRLDAAPNDLIGPAISISGIANLGTATFSPTERDIDLAELVENVTVLRLNHAFKAGVDVIVNRVRIAFPGAVQGVYSFQNLSNFLAGRYSSFQQAFGEPDTHQTNRNFGVFVQDQWRAGDRVTINGGVRYDVQQLPSLIHTDRDNISPRLGIAWDISGDRKSVLRASAGLYYDRIPLRAVSNALQRDGVTYRIAQVGANFAGAPEFPNTFSAFPGTVLTNITTIDPDIQNSRSDQLAIQYERELGPLSSASIAYEHLRGHDIIMSRNVNVPTTTDPTVPNLGRPDPRFANVGQYQSIGESWYDGMTLSIVRRPSTWWDARLSYTFSKGLDTTGNFFFSQPQDANDVAAERGRSDNDQRHRLALSGSLHTPARAWRFSYIYTYTSALPFNIQVPNDRNGDTTFNDRPAGVGRNTGQGFDYRSLDVRLSRVFTWHSVSAEAIVDVFNVLNRANYQVPINIVTLPTFGNPTAANDPRQVQFGLRLTY